MKNIFATAASILVLGLAMPAMAQSSSSTVNQIGYYNGVSVNQIGTGAVNDSKIQQGLINNNSAHNLADVQQNGYNIQTNKSEIGQDGIKNEAYVVQGGNGVGGDTNGSTIKQNGVKNVSSVTQANVEYDNKSGIVQNGIENLATVDQGNILGNNLNNKSDISQSGYSNEAHVYQGGGLSVNNSEIVQDDPLGFGGNNYAEVTQKGSSDNESHLFQHGSANWAYVTQDSAPGVFNDSVVTQTGIGNGANVFQH